MSHNLIYREASFDGRAAGQEFSPVNRGDCAPGTAFVDPLPAVKKYSLTRAIEYLHQQVGQISKELETLQLILTPIISPAITQVTLRDLRGDAVAKTEEPSLTPPRFRHTLEDLEKKLASITQQIRSVTERVEI